MSSNGGDDIRDLARELRRTNERLERLINAIIAGSTGEEPEDVAEQIDMWNVGRRSAGVANSVDEYIQMRRRAARSDTITVPRVDTNNLTKTYLEIFRRAGEHLDKINNSLNNAEWKVFIQELAIEHGVDRGLVDVLNPDPIFFAIEVVDGEVTVVVEDTHMNFIRAYGSYWYAPPRFSMVGDDPDRGPEATPWQTLDIRMDPEVEVLLGELDPIDVNKRMVEAIDETPGKSVPDKFRHLV